MSNPPDQLTITLSRNQIEEFNLLTAMPRPSHAKELRHKPGIYHI